MLGGELREAGDAGEAYKPREGTLTLLEREVCFVFFLQPNSLTSLVTTELPTLPLPHGLDPSLGLPQPQTSVSRTAFN